MVNEHNKDKDGLIVSIHFNASGGTQSRAIGTEVLYYDQKDLAAKIAKAISNATGGGLLNRGAKQRTDNFVVQAVKDGIIQDSHLKDLQSGVMTTDRLLGLYITIEQRRETK